MSYLFHVSKVFLKNAKITLAKKRAPDYLAKWQERRKELKQKRINRMKEKELEKLKKAFGLKCRIYFMSAKFFSLARLCFGTEMDSCRLASSYEKESTE
jgi:hypothetical protein